MIIIADLDKLAAWIGGAVMILAPLAALVWFWSTRKVTKRKKPKIVIREKK